MVKELILDLGDKVCTQELCHEFRIWKKEKRRERRGLYRGLCLQKVTLPVRSVTLHRLRSPGANAL